MSDCHTIKEVVRSFSEDGREFSLKYQLSTYTKPNCLGDQCSIEAQLIEKCSASEDKGSSCSVNIRKLSPEVGLWLFETIAGAQSPVFPVHLPDVVRDQIQSMSLFDVRTHR